MPRRDMIKMRRLWEAAKRDRNEERFFTDLTQGFDSGEIKPGEFSVRGLFENFVENGRELVDSWNPRHGAGSGPSSTELMESNVVNTAAFANISGQIVYNRLLEAYQAEEYVFTKLIGTTHTDLNGEKVAGIGQIGDKAEIVAEGNEYPMVGLSEDYVNTPATTKRGMIIPVTKEAVFFDRTNLILSRCAEVGKFLGLNKEKRAIDCLIDENTTIHRYNRKTAGAVASYGDNSGAHDWDNLEGSNGLVEWTDVDNAEQLMNGILDPNTGEPVVISGATLIATKALEPTAMRIRNATQIMYLPGGYATSGTPISTYGPNPKANSFDIASSRLLAARLATDTSWFYGDVGAYATYMENWPITTVKAPANSYREFYQDIVLEWKASERGQYAVLNPRSMVKSTV